MYIHYYLKCTSLDGATPVRVTLLIHQVALHTNKHDLFACRFG